MGTQLPKLENQSQKKFNFFLPPLCFFASSLPSLSLSKARVEQRRRRRVRIASRPAHHTQAVIQQRACTTGGVGVGASKERNKTNTKNQNTHPVKRRRKKESRWSIQWASPAWCPG
jgi:hypothetical protein